MEDKVKDLISIIVPVYNVEKYLDRCVQSILNQTYPYFELILVDDGSPDNCGKMCDEYAKKDDRVIVIHQENKGLSGARNAGLDYVFEKNNSQYITFIDSDDWVHDKYLEILIKEFNIKCDVCICNYIFTKTEVSFVYFIHTKSKLYLTKEFYSNHSVNATVAWGKLYRKKCFNNIRYPVGKIYEDGFTTYKILFENKYINYVDLPLYNYFNNENGIMNSKFSIKKYDGILAREERKLYFFKNGMRDLALREEEYIEIDKAIFSLMARKHKIYREVPHKYKYGHLKAILYLNKHLDRDRYESIMINNHPNLVKIQAYFHKIKEIIHLE